MIRRAFGAPKPLIVSRIAVLMLALASSYYVLYTLRFIWVPEGGFGIFIDPSTAIVSQVDPRNEALGIRLGDRVDLAAMSFLERGYLYAIMVKPVGLRMTVHVIRSGRSRAATFETVAETHTIDDVVFMWSHKIVAMLFIAMGVILVWNRPSVMLWGLAVFLIRTHPFKVGPFPTPAISEFVTFGYAFVYALGSPGLIVFAARFPDGRTNNATRFWDVAAAGVFMFYMVTLTHDYIPLFTARPIPAWPDFSNLTAVMYVAVFFVLCAKLRSKSRSNAPGLGWIVAGYGIGIVLGFVALGKLLDVVDFDSYWPMLGQLVLMLAMPASVAYSVIRHRAFGLGYLANRTLVYSALTVGVVSTFSIGVWLTSYQVASALSIGCTMFVALLVGMAFQANRSRVVRLVDRIFIPHRYEAGLALDRIRETLSRTSDAKRFTDELSATLGLASVAVFARATDGGFVRKAACGWQQGTTWHLLPDEALTNSLETGATVIELADETPGDAALPIAQARPRVALTFRRGGRVEGALFVAPYCNGASLDRDTIRSLHGVFDQAIGA